MRTVAERSASSRDMPPSCSMIAALSCHSSTSGTVIARRKACIASSKIDPFLSQNRAASRRSATVIRLISPQRYSARVALSMISGRFAC